MFHLSLKYIKNSTDAIEINIVSNIRIKHIIERFSFLNSQKTTSSLL